jgi:hypothetical protein
MAATLYLIGCVLATGQAPPAPAAHGDWVVLPRLSRGLELVYRGTYVEEARGGHMQFNRTYRLETRIFVLETPPRGAEVVLLTVLRHQTPPVANPPAERDPHRSGTPLPTEAAVSSARCERAFVDLQGRLRADGVNLAVPLEGPPLLECGAFLEAPVGRLAPEQTWDVAEVGRPLQVWHNTGSDLVGGSPCLRLAAVQQSADWDRPRGDHTAWRRRDLVWLSSRVGVACRVERLIEHREPNSQDPTQWGKLRYELDTSLQYSGVLADDRRQEIRQAFAFRDQLTPLLAQPSRFGPQLAALLKRIDYYLEHQPPTPYREAVLQVKRRAEAARRGESPPALPEESAPSTAPSVAAPGQVAPDFVATDLTGSGSARPRSWLGRPVLMVFYNPTSATAPMVLRFAQHLAAAWAHRLVVVGLSVAGNPEVVRRQHDELGLTFPILDGTGLRIGYAIETTPKFVVLDAANIVRGSWLGWGHETPEDVREELKRWMAPAVQLPPTPVP